MTLLRSAPLRARSDKQARRAAVLAKSKRIILKRANGRCEAFGEPFGDNQIDHHHVFPAKGLGLPWSDSAEAGAAVCREHHDYVQTHPFCPEQQELELAAVLRLFGRVRDAGSQMEYPQDATYRRAALLAVAELERLGVEP